jgi:putative transposase
MFLAAILDLFSRRVGGAGRRAQSNDTPLALEALNKALTARRPPPGLVHHSDRGSPHASHDYRASSDNIACIAA